MRTKTRRSSVGAIFRSTRALRPFAAPDDLILMKLKAGRPRDFEDAMSVLIAQREAIDEPYMVDWSRRLGLADELNYLLRAAE